LPLPWNLDQIKQRLTHLSRPLLLFGGSLPIPRCTPAPVYVRRARPQDSASLHPSPHLGNVAPSFFMVNAVFASGIVLRTFRFAPSLPLRCFSLRTFRFADSVAWYGRKGCCPSDLPLRSIPPTALRLWAPLYGRGWPGSSGQHPLAALALQINPPRGPNRAQRSPSFLGARPTCKTEGRPNAL